jgi:hypothetical protein
MNEKYNDFKDEDTQFDLDAYAKTLYREDGSPRIPCYVIPHVWGKDDICLHCGFAREELYGNKAAEHHVQRTACMHPEIKRLGGVLYCKVCGEQLD